MNIEEVVPASINDLLRRVGDLERIAQRPPSVLAVHSLTTAFTTTGTHTTPQDEGLTATVADVAGRRYRFSLLANPYAPGGVNTVTYSLLRNGVVIRTWDCPDRSSTTASGLTLTHTELIAASATAVYKIQVRGGANTAVSSYGAALMPRQLLIESIGTI